MSIAAGLQPLLPPAVSPAMKTLTACALLLLLSAPTFAAGKGNISVSFDSDDSRTRMASRHTAREAQLSIGTRNGAAVVMLVGDAVAVQLSDAALANLKTKEDANFLEELVLAGVGFAVRKSVEYPIANIRSAEVRDGVLVLTNDEGKPVFSDIKVNGSVVTHDLAPADAARFVNAFRQLKTSH